MTMATIDLLPKETSASGNSVRLMFATTSTSASEPSRLRRTVPAFIPADQQFYWTGKWQEGERRALADLDAGRSRQFSDPLDAIRWLLNEDG